MRKTLPAPGTCSYPRGELALWHLISKPENLPLTQRRIGLLASYLLNQRYPVPLSLLGRDSGASSETQRSNYIWNNSDSFLGSGKRDPDASLTFLQRLKESPLLRSKGSPRNLVITSNFVSPDVAKDQSKTKGTVWKIS